MHQLTDTMGQCTDETVGIINDNGNTSTPSINCNDTRYDELLSSEYGERIMISTDSKYTSISISITILHSNTQHWHIDCIRSSYYTHNESTNYNDMCIPSIIVNNIYHLLVVKYDWTQNTVVNFVGSPSTSISVFNVGTLYNSWMIYDTNNITAIMHTDEDTYQDGEHRMSMHNAGFDLAIDSIAKHNILNMENNDKDNMQASYDQLGYILGNTMTTNNVLRFGNDKVCKYIKRDDNTCKCSTNQLMFECKGIGIGNGMYKCRNANMEYNTMAIRTSSWIVLTIGYMHTTLHQLESSEHRTVCSRLDGRGVTNVEHLGNIWVRIQSQ
jgi:hypothetical protein